MSTTRRVFPEVFKREAVDRVISSGLSVGKVATELGLNETVLRRWVMRLGGQATLHHRNQYAILVEGNVGPVQVVELRQGRSGERNSHNAFPCPRAIASTIPSLGSTARYSPQGSSPKKF